MYFSVKIEMIMIMYYQNEGKICPHGISYASMIAYKELLSCYNTEDCDYNVNIFK